MNKFLVLTAILSFSLTAYAKDGEACELTKGHKLPKGIDFFEIPNDDASLFCHLAVV